MNMLGLGLLSLGNYQQTGVCLHLFVKWEFARCHGGTGAPTLVRYVQPLPHQIDEGFDWVKTGRHTCGFQELVCGDDDAVWGTARADDANFELPFVSR